MLFCKYNQERANKLTFRHAWRLVAVAVQTIPEKLKSRLPKTLKYFYFNDGLLAFFRTPLHVFVREGVIENSLCDRQLFVALLLEKQQASRSTLVASSSGPYSGPEVSHMSAAKTRKRAESLHVHIQHGLKRISNFMSLDQDCAFKNAPVC